MKIIIGADVGASKYNEGLFIDGDVMQLIGRELINELNTADIKIFDIEVPLTDRTKGISKSGPLLKQNPKAIKGIKRLNPSVVTLANNHIMDYGSEGLHDTERILKGNAIDYIGVGDSLYYARMNSYRVICKDGIQIGIYACAQHEFSVADVHSPGANPYDPLVTFDDISHLKEKCDFCIVLYHGGQELYQYPSPYIQRVFRKMADKGADVVIAQHTHCLGSYENYKDSLLVYGQGNFIFDSSDDELTKESALISIEISRRGGHGEVAFSSSFIPIQMKSDSTVKYADGGVNSKILTALENRSEEILRDRFIEQKYKDNAIENLYYMLRYVDGRSNSFIVRAVDKITGGKLTMANYNKKSLLALINVMQCQAHYELLKEGVKCYLRGND